MRNYLKLLTFDIGSLLLLAIVIPWILIGASAHQAWSVDYIQFNPRQYSSILVEKKSDAYEVSSVRPVSVRAQNITSELENFNYTVERVLADRVVAREESSEEFEIVEDVALDTAKETTINLDGEEDFVVYDYDDKSPKVSHEMQNQIDDSIEMISSAVAAQPLSSTVAYQPAPKLSKIQWNGFSEDPTASPKNSDSKKNSSQNAVTAAELKDGDIVIGEMDLSDLKRVNQTAEENKQNKSQTQNETLANSEIFLTARGVDLVNGNVQDLNLFTVEFFDNGEVFQPNKEGEVLISENLSSKFGVRSALIGARDYVPLVSDLVFEKGGVEASIPLITLDSYLTMLNQYQISEDRGAVLVEVNEETKDLEINAESVRINLDSDFKETKEDSYSYTLFMGVSPGNIVMTYKKSDDSLVSKLLFAEAGRINFEANYYVEKEDEKFELFEKAPLAIVPTPLKVGIESITEEFTNAFPEILNFNTIKFPGNSYAVGIRRYLNIQATSDRFMVGVGESTDIVLPSEVMIVSAYEALSIENLDANCLVQINTKKELKEVSYVGKGILKSGELDGPMYSMLVALDRDGEFYTDVSQETTNVFIVGEGEGTFDVNVEYKDGSKEFLKTYCKQGIHLIEQL